MEEKNKIKPRLVLVDMFNLSIGMNAVVNILNSNTEQVGMYLGTMKLIRTLADKFKAKQLYCCYDGPEAGARRRSIHKDYKDKRRVKTRHSIIKIRESENTVNEYIQKGAFEGQLGMVYNACKDLPVKNFIIQGCEADDIITYLALKNQHDYDVYIVSRDKDYLQLINENIKVYNWSSKKIYDIKLFKEEFKIHPENYIYMKILLGDVSDKVDGIKGIGKKTCELLLPFLNEKKYKDTQDFLDSFKKIDIYQFDTRVQNALLKLHTKEFVSKFLIGYQLMKLDLDCLKQHQVEMLYKQIDVQKDKKLKRMQLAILAQNHEYYRMYTGFNFDKWVIPFLVMNKN